MNLLTALFRGNSRQSGMVVALLALLAFFQVATGGLVLSPANLMTLLNGNTYILVLAIGMVLVIVAGHIDLSVGSVAAFTGIVTALAMKELGLSPCAAVPLALLLGALIGAWQGFWVAYMGLPSFVVTLAGMMLFRGANQWIGKSNTVTVPPEIQTLGGGYLPQVGPETGYNNLTLLLGLAAIVSLVGFSLRARRAEQAGGGEVIPAQVLVIRLLLFGGVIGALAVLFASGRPGTSFPVPGLVLLLLALLYTFLARHTVLGRHIYAVGGNLQAAYLSGVNTQRVTFLVMMNSSILAALAGLMFIGRATASGPFDGVGWELEAISAVFIGGAAVTGGVGTVPGALIGGLVMAVLNNGLQLLGTGADLTQMIKGFVLILAVAFDIASRQQGRPSLLTRVLRMKPRPVEAEGHAHPISAILVIIAALALVASLFVRPAATIPAEDSGRGFPAGSLIGVALPQKTSENWVLAEKLFQEGLREAGFQGDVQFANGGVPEQENQIQAMVTRGAKVLVVGAIDGSQLGSQLKEAKDSGALVIAYDRLLTNTAAVDYYVAYDNFKVGVLQGRALVEGLRKRKGSGPWNIELLAGSPDDANSQVFFKGAMSVLEPLLAQGRLRVRSGQTAFDQAATQGWKAENAQRRMDTLLAGIYGRETLHGVLAPNDTLARAVLTAARAAGKELPVVTGQDSEVESVRSLLRGEQYATIRKDTAALVRQVLTMLRDLQQGRTPEINDPASYHNGVKAVPAYLLEPLIVTRENAREAYAQDPVLSKLLQE